MLQILIGGAALDLFADTKISLEFNNPAAADEIADGSYSYPFSVPSTDHNRRLLGFGFMADNATLQREWQNAEIIIEGAWRISGTLILQYPFSDSEYSFTINTTAVLAELKNIMLTDYSLPINMGATLGEWCDAVHNFNSVAGGDVVFPIIDTETHVRHTPSTVQVFGAEGRKQNFINYYEYNYNSTSGVSFPHLWRNPFQPWLRLNKILNWIFETKINTILSGELLTGELESLIISNDTIATIYDADNNGVGSAYEPAPFPIIDIQAFVPKINAIDLLKSLRTMFGINLYTATEGFVLKANKTMLAAPSRADWSQYQSGKHTFEPKITENTLQFSHNWNDATYTDFIQKRLHILIRSENQAPAGSWFLTYFMGDVQELPADNGNINTAKLWYNTTDNYFYARISATAYHKIIINIIGEVAAIGLLPVMNNVRDTGKVYWVTGRKQYYVCLYSTGSPTYQWFSLCGKPDEAQGDTAKGDTVQPQINVMDDGDVWDPRRFTGAQNNQRFVVLKNDMPYKEYGSEQPPETSFIAFWRGNNPTSEHNDTSALYGQGSGREFGYNGGYNTIDKFNYSLLYAGEKGLYNTWLKAWEDIRQNTPVFVAYFKLPITELINFKFYERVRIGNQNYVILKISVEATLNGLGLAKVTAVRT